MRDGDTWTSAGITAGIDLALAMVEADLGVEIAAETAREMVVYHRRSGGQSQFSALQDLAPDSERMRAVLEHIRGNLGAALTVEHLAEVACVSPVSYTHLDKYAIRNPIFKPSPITPAYKDFLIFEGISVDEGGKQHYLDVNVAYRQACLNAIEYLKKFGYSGAQAYSCLLHI